jgi:hypothetical protein
MLEDGEPADPAAFVTAIPTWWEDDSLLAGELLTRFRYRRDRARRRGRRGAGDVRRFLAR